WVRSARMRGAPRWLLRSRRGSQQRWGWHDASFRSLENDLAPGFTRHAANVVKLQAAALDSVAGIQLQNPKPAHVGPHLAGIAASEEEHRPFPLLDRGKARHGHRDAINRSAFHIDRHVPGIPLQHFFHGEGCVRDDELVTVLVDLTRRVHLSNRGHDYSV